MSSRAQIIYFLSTRMGAVIGLGAVTFYFMSSSDDSTVERRKEEGYPYDAKTAYYRRKFMENVDKKEKK
ncbi:hypothetical protein KP79_PYT09922 [Mizuhopecten yessoensis]|uniref:Uncharacterized protein n=1 Tax=Mizuhopecten yessoensis TaxID=6573 RepID=A0A210Q6M7_MIZYE|nr:hypothetical protein KP79_PYT09922 [Mizuhopecten yessoensis]